MVNIATEKILGIKAERILDEKLFFLKKQLQDEFQYDKTNSSENFETLTELKEVSMKEIFEDPSYLGKCYSKIAKVRLMHVNPHTEFEK